MTTLFLKLVDMSVSASWLVLAVIAARLLLNKAPKSIRCVLWALVAVRLLCPFSFESEWSLIPEASSSLPAEVAAVVSDPEPGEIVYAYSAPAGNEQAEADSELYLAVPNAGGTKIVGPVEAETTGFWLRTVSGIWAMGMAVLLVYALWSYRRIHQKVAASIDIGKNVHICDYIDSPFILGIVRPKIYLPSSLSPDDAAYVLAHERAHLKRRDHWWKPLGFFLLAVYWFNPLLWVAYILLCRDIELACDERVIKEMGLDHKKAYSEALLSCSVPRHMIAACPLAFGEVGVKARVKSVLNYKKPAFWILVITTAQCILVALCFMTSPSTHTLANLGSLDTESVQCVDLNTRWGFTHLASDADMTAIWEILENTKYDATPLSDAPITDLSGENGWGYPSLEVCYEGDAQTVYYFDEDCTIVWAADASGATLPYSVKNPELLREIFEDYLDAIKNQAVTAEPFAAIDEGWAWARNVSTDAIETARISHTWGNSSTAGYLRRSRMDALASILNALPQESIVKGEYLEEYSMLDLMFPKQTPYATIVLVDGTNGITAVIRYYGDNLELVLCSGTEALENWEEVYHGAQFWRIESEELEAFLQEYQEHHDAIHVPVGAELDWLEERLTVSHGNAVIYANMLSDWDYEAVEYTAGADSFGIRCRPKEADKGWIYFSFWPEGYATEEADRFFSESYPDGYHSISSYPAEVIDKNGYDLRDAIPSYSKIEYSVGDYAVIYADVDSWYFEYQESVNAVELYARFQYGTPLGSDGYRKAYGDVTVDFSGLASAGSWGCLNYHDWDEIAGELDAKKLALFDPQEFGDSLFVGCQSGEEYGIAVFQNKAQSGYAYTELITDAEMQHNDADQRTVIPHTLYEASGFDLQLCLLTNPDVTAISFYEYDYHYFVPDHIPALLVLDVTGSESTHRLTCNIFYEEPVSFFHSVEGDGSAVTFGTEEAAVDASWNRSYIRSTLAFFYDGTTNPGNFNLTQEEQWQLRDILLSLTAAEITPISEEETVPLPDGDDRYTQLLVTTHKGRLESGAHWNFDFIWTEEQVTMSLYLTNDNGATKEAEYFFTVQNDALTAFLQGLCDSGRTESEVRYNTNGFTPEESYAEYSYDYASIRIRKQSGWVYETVAYTDDDTPFGIRCRPEWAEEGWLFFSYWPKEFTPDDEGCYLDTSTITGSEDFSLTWTRSYPEKPAVDTEYAQTHYPSAWTYTHYLGLPGDYVVLNEGAESWLDLESSRWPLYALFTSTEFGEGNLTEAEVIQTIRALCENSTEGIPSKAYINATASNLTPGFDFHTGTWSALLQRKDSDDLILIQLDHEGNLLTSPVE